VASLEAEQQKDASLWKMGRTSFNTCRQHFPTMPHLWAKKDTSVTPKYEEREKFQKFLTLLQQGGWTR